MRRQKKCRCCGQLFQPHPQTYRQQKTCSKPGCRAWRIGQKGRIWRMKNPLYGVSRAGKVQRWRQENGSPYMRKYRKQHPGYVEQNRRGQRHRNERRRLIVKQTEWGALCREKTSQNRSLRLIVKQTEWIPLLFHQVDGIWKALQRLEPIVKRTDIDAGP